MKDVIYLLCTIDEDGSFLGDLDCFYEDPVEAIRNAICINLDIIKREYTDDLLLFQPGYSEDSNCCEEHLLNFRSEGDAAFMAAHFAASCIYGYDSFYPSLYTVTPIEKYS